MNDLLTQIREKGSSAVAIANKLKIDKSTVTRQLKGDTKKLKPEVQKEIEKILGHSLIDIVNNKQPLIKSSKPKKEPTEITTDINIPDNTFDEFIEYQKAAPVSDNTIKNYDKSIGRFLHYNKKTNEFEYEKDRNKLTHPENVYSNTQDIIKYLNQFEGNKNGFANRHFHWRNLKTFYIWLEKYHYPNPIVKREGGKTGYLVKEPLLNKESIEASITEEEVKKLLASDKLDNRFKMMIAIPFYSSMRVSEWMDLKAEEINLEKKIVVRKVKGQHEAFKHLSLSTPYIKAYLAETGIKSGRLLQDIPELNYQALSTIRGIESHFSRRDKLAQQLTGNEKLHLTPHVFRRGFARMMQAHKINDTVGMSLGGWKSQKLYKKYGNDLGIEEMGKIVEQTLGLAN